MDGIPSEIYGFWTCLRSERLPLTTYTSAFHYITRDVFYWNTIYGCTQIEVRYAHKPICHQGAEWTSINLRKRKFAEVSLDLREMKGLFG